jgi:hypothetical protein
MGSSKLRLRKPLGNERASLATAMQISKSSRHSKITGDFAEGLVLYLLSKYGFESARVDHTGIDLISRNPRTHELMGISVKSRSRNVGTEKTSISIPEDNFVKANAACKSFGCVPYFAIVADTNDAIRVFLTSMVRFRKICPKRLKGSHWRMTPSALAQYAEDNLIKCFEFRSSVCRW